VSHATMSAGKLFHNRAPAVVKARSPTVAHCDWRTSSWLVSDDRRRHLLLACLRTYLFTAACCSV